MIDQAIQRLLQAGSTQTPCQPVRELIGDADVDTAYAVQEAITQQRLAGGGRIVGRKIGLTAPSVQKQLGVDQPDYGTLFADMDVMNGHTIAWSEVCQPKVEAEVAFVMKSAVTRSDATISEVMGAIDYAVAAIEVVGSRIADWNIRITDTIADNASSSHFVLGHQPMPLSEVDLVNCAMTLSVNDQEVSSGQGKACLGSPINATLWLARQMAQQGTPLQAGDVVLAGALGPMVAVNPGDQAVAHIEGLGEVSVSFSEAR